MDQQLRSLVDKHGPKRWSVIAKELKVKSSKQCRRRWKNVLNANRKTGDWTKEEDQTLIEGHKVHGNRWETLAQLVGGRTDNAVKNRWAVLCKKAAHRPSRRSQTTASQSPPARASVVQPDTPQPPPAHPLRLSSDAETVQQPAMAAPAAAEAPGRSARSTARQRRKPVRGLTITIPPQPPEDSIDSRGSSEQGPVYIRVHKALLTPTEVQLAADINALGGQVMIQLQDSPPSSTSSDGRQWAAAAVSSLQSPGTSNLQSPAFQKMMNFCLHTGLTPRPQGLRSSARLAGQSASELNDRHRQLLHKLLWRGKVSCSPAPRHKEANSSAPVAHAGRAAPRSRPAQGGTAGSESRLRQRVSPNAGAGPAPPSPDQQHCDVVLSPVFSQEEIDMLLDALSQPAGEASGRP